MGCCKDKGAHKETQGNNFNCAFLIIVLYILLAIILGGILYY